MHLFLSLSKLHPGAATPGGQAAGSSVFEGLDFDQLPNKLTQAASQKERDTLDRCVREI